MNKVIFIGNLASDVELKATQKGKPVASFRLAVQRKYPNQQGQREADFFTIIAYNNLAETCTRFLYKGKKISVVGAIQNRNYTAQDGAKRYITEIIADEIEFVDSKPQNEAPASAAAASQAPTTQDEPPPANINDDLPF